MKMDTAYAALRINHQNINRMKKNVLLTLSVALCIPVFSQTLTFNATGAATTIEKVKAENLRTRDTVSVNGNIILLKGPQDINDKQQSDLLKVYPNPFADYTLFEYGTEQGENVSITITNSLGQLIANMEKYLTMGTHCFEFEPSEAGIYNLSIKSDGKKYSQTLVCDHAKKMGNTIIYKNYKSIAREKSATVLAGNELNYIPGDVIKFECSTGIYGAVLADAPTQDKTYTVEFVACVDADSVHHYKTVKICNQTWMAENVNAGVMLQHSGNTISQTDNDRIDKFCYDNDRVNCDKYGGLYTWHETMQYASSDNGSIGKVQGVCPTGWHIPTDKEWQVLIDCLGDDSTSGGKMKALGIFEDNTGNWYSPNAYATNSSGFSAEPGGYICYKCGGSFNYIHREGRYWAATLCSSSVSSAISRYFFYNSALARWLDTVDIDDSQSVRCIKN